MTFFSKTVRPMNMKLFLYKVSIWVNIQKKFHVPRLHSIGEKFDANSKYHGIFLKNCATDEHEIVFV